MSALPRHHQLLSPRLPLYRAGTKIASQITQNLFHLSSSAVVLPDAAALRVVPFVEEPQDEQVLDVARLVAAELPGAEALRVAPLVEAAAELPEPARLVVAEL